MTIGEIIPATIFGNGLCFKNIAKQKGLMKYWSDQSNKKEHYPIFSKIFIDINQLCSEK